VKQRAAKLAVAILLLVHAAVLLAGFCAPYDPAEQDRSFPFAPPTRIHLVDATGNLHLRPFVYGLVPKTGSFAEYEEDRSKQYPISFLVRGDQYRFAGMLPGNLHLFGVAASGHLFLLGTDGYGRDQYSRLLYGSQISLLAGLVAAGLALVVGMMMGTLAGYSGGRVDDLLMRLAELFLAVPWLYLLLAVRAFLPLQLSALAAFLLLVAVIGAVGWARPARLIRGVVLSAKERNYVLAARGFGASDLYLVRRHVLPQTYGVLLTLAALLIPQYILAEVTFSFLGLGVAEPTPSLGNMLGSLQQYHVLASYWWMLAPGLVLIPLFWSYYVLADTLQKRLESSH
jgi:peptide/nickel transport system permease protein